MSSSLEQDYFDWLASPIRDASRGTRTYENLISLMHEKEFVWIVPNDANRLADGLDLRVEFCRERNLPTDIREKLGPCSFLEALIGLSRRLEFAAGGEAPGWAWTLVKNLELHKMADPIGRTRAKRVDDILDACIWRSYMPTGEGGFFPLAWPDEDQTKVELWYQMAAWIDELHPEHFP